MLHKNVTTGDQHFLHNWTVSSTSNLAGIPVVASDQGKVALVTANSSFYILQDSTPTWQALGGAGGGGGAAISAGTQSVSTGTVAFSNSNNVSFGMSGSNQVTASYNFNISAGTTSGNRNNVTFADSNGVSFGFNAGTVTATVKTDYQSSNANYLTSQSNQAASASNGSFAFQTLGFSNANGVTFGTSAGSIVTASVAAGGGGTLSAWEPSPPIGTSFSSLGQNSLWFSPFIVPSNLSFSRINCIQSINYGTSANNSNSQVETYQWGIYSRIDATTSKLSLVFSGSGIGQTTQNSNVSYAAGFTGGTFSNSTSSAAAFSGTAQNFSVNILPFGIASSLSGGEYWLGIVHSTAHLNNSGFSIGFLFNNSGMTNGSIGIRGYQGNTYTTNALLQGMGTYSVTSGALPNTVGLSEIKGVSNMRLYFNFVNAGVLYN